MLHWIRSQILIPGKVPLKELLAESVIEKLKPIREKTLDILNNRDYIDHVLDRGAVQATAIAAKTMDDVKNIVGLRMRWHYQLETMNCSAL